MLFTPGIVEEVENIKSKLSFLDKFTVSASKIQQLSIYEKTLEETSRKQNTLDGLVNIHDKVFKFFWDIGTAISFQFIYEHWFSIINTCIDMFVNNFKWLKACSTFHPLSFIF